MENILLSIDWDYFIPIKKEWCGSYIENKKNLMSIWYKRYFKNKMFGIDISKTVTLGKEYKNFLDKIRKIFIFDNNLKIYVSESHKLSYDIAKESKCTQVFSFDAHSDLGYGGLSSLNFEINCANWLGKLLKNKIITTANIIYSPYTHEFKDEFKEINDSFNVNYLKLDKIINKIHVSAIHICRSGAWTPPWLDFKFNSLINNLGYPYKIIDCPTRIWDTKHLNLSNKLDLLYC